ncbi:hypothetical protein DOTSEDRAFT_76048 [Dothistroma septosporum NZE10]|uniref:Uncharacterized protein n=1 Tax=Dothistroma septosporum (strain NZE10 / CBS 128990) TaxID=675120 RepID=N1PZF3_DOTSN|nr:hypothetical protein DOTSEDRAFT_76048 [Dothistroma septosporum NZE10]
MARKSATSPQLLRSSEKVLAARRSKSNVRQTAESEDALKNSLSNDVMTGANGLVEHLRDELPDANGYTSADDQQRAEHQLLAESARTSIASTAPERKGKLKKLNHLGLTAGHQRRLGKTTKVRPDQYDLGVSPQKPRHAPSGLLDGPPQPSPLKKQRKAQRIQQRAETATVTGTVSALRVPLDHSVEEDIKGAPRRSSRKTKGSERDSSPQALVDDADGPSESPHKSLVQQPAGDARRMEPDDDEYAQGSNNLAQASAQKRPRGRPRKHTEAIVDSIEVRELEEGSPEDQRSSLRPTERPSSGKRSRGRPPERKSGVYGTTEVKEPPKNFHGGLDVEPQADAAPAVDEHGGDGDDGGDGEDGEDAAGENDGSVQFDECAPSDEPAEVSGHPKVIIVRQSEMFGSGAPDVNLMDDIGLEEQSMRQSQNRKRAAEQAKTSKQKKPKLTSQADVPDTADASIRQLEANEEDGNDSRLLGQWQALNRVFRNVKKVGVSVKDGEELDRTRIDLRDADVIAIKRLCSKARATLDRLKDDPHSRRDLSDPPEELDEIRLRVQGLCGKSGDYPTNLNSKRKPLEIYANLIPHVLIKLLKCMVQSYSDMDKEDADQDSDLTEAHLTTVTKFVGLILSMGAGAELYTVRPHSDLAIVRPVKNGLIVPLRLIKAVFAAHLAELERARQARERHDQAQRDRAQQDRRELQEKRQRAEEGKLRKKWKCLHDSRRFVEGGLLSREKQKHLRFPDPTDAELEYDSTGRSFQRQQVFRTRTGPHPAAAERARSAIWPLKALEALQSGLRRHTGPLVYENIFAEHCREVRGALNPYNVTEIVSVAAMLKGFLIDNGDMEDWVRAIPVWPKEYEVVGEEDGVVDEGIENVDIDVNLDEEE